jgi:hypothetical protein
MDLEKVLAELRKERAAIDAAISSLERLDRPGNLRPGLPLGLAAKSPTNGANGHRRSAVLAPGEESI